MSNSAGKGDNLRKGANLSAYWSNYDDIFRRPKKTIAEWAAHFGDHIKSYDGFREYSCADLLTEEEYKGGLIRCTVYYVPSIFEAAKTPQVMNNNKCYSHNEEYFYPDLEAPLQQAVENFLDNNEGFEGETEIELFEADKIHNSISKFLGTCIADVLVETACDDDDGGEMSEVWGAKILKNHQKIQKTVRDALENWANLTNNQPSFFGVKNVRPITVKIRLTKREIGGN